jgi:CBS domain-containing protein
MRQGSPRSLDLSDDELMTESPLAAPASDATVEVPVVAPETPVAQVARLMTEMNVTSAVIAGEQIGIVTDRDLRKRVLADGRPPDTPIGDVMSTPAVTVTADSSVGDVVAIMLEARFQHVPVLDGTHVLGVVDARRALATIDPTPLRAGLRLRRAVSGEEMATVLAEVPDGVDRLLTTGMSAVGSLRAISAFSDAVTRRAIALAGDPPTEITWMALGSQGRREQSLKTDQDHCLIVREGDPEAARRWASTVVDILARAGLPRCGGGTMSSEPAWCHTPDGWNQWIATRMAEAERKAVLEAATAMDARPVLGPDDEVFARLRLRAAGSAPFMARLAAAATHFRVPLSLFGHISKRFDIKEGVIGPITIIARVMGLAAGSDAEDTLGRLEDAESDGRVSADLGEVLRQGFEVAQRIRLEDQVDAYRSRRAYSNEVSHDRLTSWEATLLEEVAKAIKDAQGSLASTYQTGYVR